MPRKPADYPEWVMKYKKKGTYINKVGDKYYLYAAHSERIKGTNKVRRVSDGYLGRITEKDGLIPAKKILRSAPVTFELGLSFFIISQTSDILNGLKKSYRRNGELIYCCSLLSVIYGTYSPSLFSHSYTSLRFPGVSFPAAFSDAILSGIERGVRMLNDRLKHLADKRNDIFVFFPDIRLIKAEGTYYISGFTDEIQKLSDELNLKWEDLLWQK